MSDLIKDIIDFNEEIITLSKCESHESTLKFWTSKPSNNDIKIQLSVLEDPGCPEPLLRYIYQISLEEGHAFDSMIMWYLQSICRNPNTPDDLIVDLVNYGENFENIDVGQVFVNELASSHPSFDINNSSKDIESYNRYVLKGALSNSKTSKNIKNKIKELLKDTEKYPLHWMEISMETHQKFLDVNSKRFHTKLHLEGSLIKEEIFCENEDYEDFDIEELRSCHLENEDFFEENKVNDHASEIYFYNDESSHLAIGPAFFQSSIYIPNYEGMSVSVVNVSDVLEPLIRDFWSKDLLSLLDEHGEWLCLYKDINHLLNLLEANSSSVSDFIPDKKKQIIDQIRKFSLGENIAALMYSIADASDGNLDEKEKDFIRIHITSPKIKINEFRQYVIDLSYGYDEILLDNMKSDDKEIFDTFIDEKSLTAIEKWWKDDWYDFFWDDENRMTFFQSEFIPFYKELISKKNSTFKKWILIMISELLKADGNFTETKQAWAEGLKIDLGLDNIDGDSFTGHQKVTYDSGNSYEGDFVDGYREGKGIFKWADGDKYEGDWVRGAHHGKGTFYWKDGDKYEGDWVDNSRTGSGVFSWADGDKYEGDFVNNLRTGKGTFFYASGNVYDGSWLDDSRHGKGVFTWSKTGNKYEGDWFEGKRHGKGVYEWADGDKYEGDWVSGSKQGKGIFNWANGDKYEGDWVDNEYEGRGVFTWKSGDKFEGNWVKGKMNEGVYTWSDGDKYKGKINFDKNIQIHNLDSHSEFLIKYKPSINSDKLLQILKTTSVDDSDLIELVAGRSDIDKRCKQIIDIKLQLKDRSDNNWAESSGLINEKWSRDVYESLHKDRNEFIRSFLLINPYIPEDLILIMINNEEVTIDEKLHALKNQSCPIEVIDILCNDQKDYTSSRVRKAVALNLKTPKKIINNLLKDSYRWVREAAASNAKISGKEISDNLLKADRYILKGYKLNKNCSEGDRNQISTLLKDESKYPIETDLYKLGFNCNVYPAEYAAGDVSASELADCIIDYEGEWSSYVWDNDWYSFDSYYHFYGMSDVARDVQYPGGDILPITIKEKQVPDINLDIYGVKGFACSAVSYEKGYGWNDWIHYEAELEYELKPECITPLYDGSICDSYEYYAKNLDGSDESTTFESNDSYSTTGKGTDFEINVDTEELILKMEESGVDIKNREAVVNWLENYIKK